MANELKAYMNAPAVVKNLSETLGRNAQSLITSALSAVNGNYQLRDATPESVYQAVMKAATLDLPVEPNLGFSYIVPYKDKNKGTVEAQLQIGYRGFTQLALRSGQVRNINVGTIYTSQFISYDPLFEKLEVDFSKAENDEVAGYFATIELLNGFRKLIYWNYGKVYAHGKRFSKSFANGPWKTDFDAMAQKTVLKHLLKNYAPLSQEMQKAIDFDDDTEDLKAAPVDVTEEPETLKDLLEVDPETGEIPETSKSDKSEPEQLDLGVSYEDPNAK